MKLYEFSRSHNSRRVRIFLAEKGIEIAHEHIDITRGESRTPAFLAKNPMGRVPVLELDDGSFVAESVAICRYFEAVRTEPPLFGTTAKGKAEIEMWSRRIEFGFCEPLEQMWRHDSPRWAGHVNQIPQFAAEERERVFEFLRLLDGALTSRPYIAGPNFSMADILGLCTLDLATKVVMLTQEPNQHHLARWHHLVSSRPSATA